MKAIVIILLALAVAGCQTDGTTRSVIRDVCPALTHPIKYTSKNRKSDYYAARKLAPQLAEKNAVGVNLRCPNYR